MFGKKIDQTLELAKQIYLGLVATPEFHKATLDHMGKVGAEKTLTMLETAADQSISIACVFTKRADKIGLLEKKPFAWWRKR